MDNNKAFVCKLGNIKKIEGADKIVTAQVLLANIPLTQVVVGIDTLEDTPIVYFDSNLSISQEIIEKIDRLDLKYNTEEFKSLNTYLARGNRVRCIKLKGTISNGLAVNLDKFYQFFSSEEEAKSILIEGYEFTHINGIEICKKWLPSDKNTQSNKMKEKKGKKKVSRIIPELFHFHINTPQILKNLHLLEKDKIIALSRKVHGTSAICSYAKVLKKLSLKDRIAKLFGVSVLETEYDYIYASRTIIKNEATHTGFYKFDLWSKVGKDNFVGKLKKGETVYYEIVGYIPDTETYIQSGYDYGCNKGEYKIAIYRITQTNDDGEVFEYSWQALKERCKELNIPMVEEYYYGKVCHKYDIDYRSDDWKLVYIEKLRNEFLEKDCWDNLTKRVPDEGIVIRIESKDICVAKFKSEKFFLHESTAKEDETNVDMEDEEVIRIEGDI
jgi:hypothetical protein